MPDTVSRNFDQPGRSPVYAANAMAATSHPLATSTALTVLREGGNAVDAAIAASATLCVVEPHMTGIGGDCFAFVGEPSGTIHALNASGRAAAGAKLAWYLENGISEIADTSPHAVTAPGALRGWELLHRKFGAMDWARLFADAVDYAEGGFPVAPRVAHDWHGLAGKLADNEGAAKHLLFDGTSPGVGQKIRLPALGQTLSRIAREGADAFYLGQIAAEIAGTVQALGGFLSEEDLAKCSAEWVEPIRTTYHDHEVLQIPPNGQGITALIILDLLTMGGGRHDALSAERFHQSIEFARLAYAMRDAHVSDPATAKTGVKAMLSEETTMALLRQYDPERRNDDITLPELPDADTIYLSVVDRDGLAVSFINSVYSGFGTGIVTGKSGIALQNRGSCFVVREGHPNAIGGAKRPMHTIIPGMVLKDGLPAFSFGVMGGAYQPAGQAHVLQNMFEYGMDPQQAIDFPRLFWRPDGVLAAESGIGPHIKAGLAGRGHETAPGGLHGGGQMVAIDRQSGVLIGASDPRKDGHAAGY
ncbi:gamma-glutamyltransferase family protein [Salaquimonas pukyongi]|uniref:gamma-glutamyltransferase family protein n=1 Tax=Salaquimonas pukyongi TaxID=2712698 RepID=UPI001FCE2949|nr:gamma-glutamyltransferase family protein [Salaquimonas pukyongi]